MPAIQVSGVLPARMVENSGSADWVATLQLSGDLAGLSRVELLGRDALDFQASLLPGSGAVVLTPAAPVDYESLLAAGRSPVLDVSLRFVWQDGSRQDDPVVRHVTVLNADDTPPTGLAFASGGTVEAGAIGAAIGRLAVTDPDSSGRFVFSFTADDAWRFEVVDNVLKLRDGISLGLDDMPRRPLIIEVSDGHQSAAFTLDLRVTDPATRLADLPAGETRGGFQLAGAGVVVAMRESRDVADSHLLGAGGQVLTLQEGTQVTLPAAQRVQMLDGFQDIGPQSPGVQAAALVHALTGQEADGKALAALVARAEAGTAWTDIAATLPGLAALPAANAAAVADLYHNALGRDPTGEELALQTQRLASGVPRAQLAVDLALGAESLDRQPDAGVWVADPLGTDGAWRAGTGGLPATAPVTAATDPVWVL
ncbi:hypothetical protein [Paracraurococcus lichenis]|uniref:DUF4214 domain-containing protein n=1 Tax=Paracraurococcus lichenis TaxID=3064888 RepID=A0ABT9E539_9PROT|nr:hypothetical protein [Paracraurococcus sp. LOR1-02]MDO9711295.1 hypothetical protein [Paracraurococcus sp. LOR1-02]